MAREKLGDYEIVREIGRGGMGAVYEAKSPTGDRVALKTMVMPAELDSRARWEMVDRFMTEARAIRAMDHKNVVSVLDTGEDGGEFYIVMELLEGQSVRQLLDMMGPISPSRARQIACDVCAALSYAHGLGVIHRDIKPDNIVILKNGVTKLTDFGLARIGEIGSHTHAGTMMGTFAYMSPEQARGEKLDARSDIFSLGVTLYEMVCGRRPFEDNGTAAVLQAILARDPEPPADAPADLSAAIMRCLAKDPAARFQATAELLRALEQPQQGTVVGRPILTPGAPQPSPTQPTSAPGSTQAPQPAKPAGGIRKEDAQVPPGWFDRDSPVGPGTRPAAGPPTSAAGQRSTDVPTRPCECGEAWRPGDTVCWKCGRPNPIAVAKQQRLKEQQALREVQQLAGSLAPRKKPWWKVW
jgi:serine/threonine-protein kinase